MLLLCSCSIFSHKKTFYPMQEFKDFGRDFHSELIHNNDTLFSNYLFTLGNKFTYKKKFTGIYLEKNKEKVHFICYLRKGQLTGYYMIIDKDKKLIEQGFYIDNVKTKIALF